MTSEHEQIIEFYCSLIDKKVTHKLNSSFFNQRKKFPFPYIFTHKNSENNKKIFTILYLDKDFQVVKTNSKYIEEEENYPLIQEILQLEHDFKQLYSKYQTSISGLKQKILNLKKEDLNSHK